MAAITFSEFEAGVRRAEGDIAKGRWRSAFEVYSALLRRRVQDLGYQAAELTATDVLVLERVADIAVPLGETNAADALYAIACDRHDAHDPERYVHAAAKRVLIALAADRFDAAMQLARALEPALGPLAAIECNDEGLAAWEQARPWRPHERAALETQLYLTLGRLLAGMGQYRDARALYHRGCHYAGAGRPSLAQEARTPLHLANASAALHCGEITDAKAMLADLIDSRSRPGDLIRWHEISAAAAILAGDFVAAGKALDDAVHVCRANGFSHALATVMLARAKLLIVVNQVREGTDAIAEVHGIATTLGAPGLVHRASRLSGFARLRQQMVFGDAPFALSAAQLQVGTREIERTHVAIARPEVVTWRPSDFFSYYEERELELMATAEAEGPSARRDRLLDLLQADFGHTDSPLLQARLQLLRGVAGVQAGEWRAASVRCLNAAGTFAALDIPADEYVARRFASLCAERISESTPTARSLRARAQHLLDRLTTPLSANARDAYLVNKWSQREAELAEAVSGLLAERQRLQHRRDPVQWLARVAWCGKVGALYRALLTGDASAPASGLRALLDRITGLLALILHPREAQTITFISLPNAIVRLDVRSFHADLESQPLPRGRLRALVGQFHELIASGDRVADEGAAATAREMGHALHIDGMLRAVPPRVRRLRILPDDQLHSFPLAVLPVDATTCVVDRWAVTVGVRRAQRSKADASVARAVPRVTIAATRGGAEWPHLPEADAQSQWLSDWWAARGVHAERLSDADCDAGQFLDGLCSSSVFHFSGHGSFDANVPTATGVVVRGSGSSSAIVDITTMATVDCRRLQLATLFSCWSADGFLFPEQWAVSVPTTLCRAGAHTVVAPLWEIEDRISTEMLQGLYRRLEVMRVDEAVRLVQLQLRTTVDGRRRSPYFWAGLQVYGDGRQLRLQSLGRFRWPN